MYVNVHVGRTLCPYSKHFQHTWLVVFHWLQKRVLWVHVSQHGAVHAQSWLTWCRLAQCFGRSRICKGCEGKTGLSVNNSNKAGCTPARASTVVEHRAFVSCHRLWKNWCHRKFNSHTLRYLRVKFPRIFSIQIPNILRLCGIPEGTLSQNMVPPSFITYRQFAAMRLATSTHLD